MVATTHTAIDSSPEQLSLFPPAPRLDPYEVLDRAIAEHNPTHVFALERLPFMEREGLPRNRVVDVLHFSGECLDGSKSSPGERQLLRDFFPAAEQQISDLEAEAREAGVPACRWGQRPPPSSAQSRLRGPSLFDYLPMCVGCPAFQGEQP